MPPSDASTVDDKTKDQKKDAPNGAHLSQEANDPKNQDGKGKQPVETDKVPKATVTKGRVDIFRRI
ncbi:hypothetical protein BH10CYA1_BH10CYA1_02570 [soil metagenome]